MNLQQAYNDIKIHLLTQMEKSMGDVSCMYRSESGLSCAVGCLIPDSKIKRLMEGRSASNLVGRFQELHEFILFDDVSINESINFISSMQKIHDNYNVHVWEHQLSLVAKEYGLAD